MRRQQHCTTGGRNSGGKTVMNKRRASACLVVGAAVLVSGCVTSLNDIRNREVQDDLVTAKSIPEIHDCLLATLGILRTPVTLGDDKRSEVMFSMPAAGVVFHYTLTAVENGTRVQARRKNNIADGFDNARK